MMNPTDNNFSGRGLNDFSRQFSAIRDDVILDWKNQVVRRIRRASALQETTLIDALPLIFDGLAQALTPDYPRALATSGSNVALSHGAERAGHSSYRPRDVAEELLIFRDSIFSVASTKGIRFSADQVEIIGRSIDAAMLESLSTFGNAHQENTELFIATLAHDLRNPLHTANASVQLIKVQSRSQSITQLATKTIARLNDVNAMVEALLDAVASQHRKKLKLRIELVNINELAAEVAHNMQLASTIVLNATQTMEGFWCRRSLTRAIQNLLSNADRYGAKGRPITLSIGRFDDRMLLSVHNEGDPIPEEKLAQIFAAFERLDDVSLTGWGLGLPLVQIVAESHGGSVVLDSEAGRGTTFSLSIPIDSRPFVDDD